MFQLTRGEAMALVMCNFCTSREDESVKSQIVTSRDTTMFVGQNGGGRELPYVFTEQGIYMLIIYMLMTVFKGELAVKQKMEIIIFTDNVRSYLRKSDLIDFEKERPDLEITFIKTGGRIHDRFIILDERKVYSSGGSSKDAGAKMTTIHEITEKFMLDSLFAEIEKLKRNGFLKLK